MEKLVKVYFDEYTLDEIKTFIKVLQSFHAACTSEVEGADLDEMETDEIREADISSKAAFRVETNFPKFFLTEEQRFILSIREQ